MGAGIQGSKKLKKSKKIELPSREDLEKFTTYIKTEEIRAQENLEKNPSKHTYRYLQELTIAHIITFNKRRSGETHRTKVTDYLERESLSTKVKNNLDGILTPIEMQLQNTLTYFTVQGKNMEQVPIVLTPAMTKSIDLLIAKRAIVKLQDSEYLFAIPHMPNSPHRGWKAVNKLAKACGAENPQLLNAKSLRIEFATMCQIFCLTESEINILAQHMGHSRPVHDAIYKKTHPQVETCLVSSLLVMLEGSVEEIKEKKKYELTGHDERQPW